MSQLKNKNNVHNEVFDILSIDSKIKKKFNDDIDNINNFKSKLSDIKKTLESKTFSPQFSKYDEILSPSPLILSPSNVKISSRLVKNIQNNVDELEKKIVEIESRQKYDFYILETFFLIERYKTLLQTPVKMSFIGKSQQNIKEKDDIISKYMKIAHNYIDISSSDIPLKKSPEIKRVTCNKCDNKRDFDIIDGSIYICILCGSQQEILLHTSSYKDSDRANISSKYTYDRKVHFRDCINQYQGKQNSTIEYNVLNELDDQFEKHHLTSSPKIFNHDGLLKFPNPSRYENITKEHTHIFLKELSYTKHYENINLIHYLITGKKPDDISYLEDKLLDDFDILTELYDKMFKNKTGYDRKNFINTQYVLYQLLMKYKHPCKKEEFTILKTVDRKNFHDDICRELFSILEWSFNSLS